MMEIIVDILDDIKKKIEGYIKNNKENSKTREEFLKTYSQLIISKCKNDNEKSNMQINNQQEVNKLKEELKGEQGMIIKEKEMIISGLNEELKVLKLNTGNNDYELTWKKGINNLIELQKKMIIDMNDDIEMQKKEEFYLKELLNDKKGKYTDLEVLCNDYQKKLSEPKRRRIQGKAEKNPVYI